MKRALVIGGSGLVGTHLLRALADEGGWDVVATQRQTPSGMTQAYRIMSLDFEKPAEAGCRLRELDAVNHVFYLARSWQAGYVIERKANVDALAIVLDALQDLPSLEQVQVVHGLKWYGSTRGPFRVPAREGDPPPDHGHFYVAQRDLLVERSASRAWHWTTWRPHCVSGVAVGSPSNVMLGMALYATLSGEPGNALYFPGSEAAFNARLSYSDADLLAAAMVWAATSPNSRDEDFNLANGDTFAWADLWPQFAARFGRTAATARPQLLHRVMPAQAGRWRTMAMRDGLREPDLARLVDWHFMDATLSLGWDQVMSLEKLHASGFTRTVDTATMIERIVGGYRRLAILPPAP